VSGIEEIPVLIRAGGIVCGEFFSGGLETGGEVLGEVRERFDFGEELRAAREQDFAKQGIETSGALRFGGLKIVRVQRSKVGNDAKMMGMAEHSLQQREERASEALAQSGRNDQNLKGVGRAAAAAHAERFIEIDAEHSVGSFQALEDSGVGTRFFLREGSSPVTRDSSTK